MLVTNLFRGALLQPQIDKKSRASYEPGEFLGVLGVEAGKEKKDLFFILVRSLCCRRYGRRTQADPCGPPEHNAFTLLHTFPDRLSSRPGTLSALFLRLSALFLRLVPQRRRTLNFCGTQLHEDHVPFFARAHIDGVG